MWNFWKQTSRYVYIFGPLKRLESWRVSRLTIVQHRLKYVSKKAFISYRYRTNSHRCKTCARIFGRLIILNQDNARSRNAKFIQIRSENFARTYHSFRFLKPTIFLRGIWEIKRLWKLYYAITYNGYVIYKRTSYSRLPLRYGTIKFVNIRTCRNDSILDKRIEIIPVTVYVYSADD